LSEAGEPKSMWRRIRNKMYIKVIAFVEGSTVNVLAFW
jgi:hypothetical protein